MALEGFGGRLKAIRQERGYTQNQLANFLGVTEQAVSKYERGNSYPDVVMLDGISRVLDCSLDYLFQFKPGRKNLLLQDSIENQLETAKCLLPDIISLKFGEKLVPLFIEEIQRGGVHINSLREQMAQQWGILVPAIRIMDQFELKNCQYQICINGVPVFENIVENIKDSAETVQFDTDILSDILSNLEKMIFQNIGQILTNQSIYFMVENLQEKYPYVVENIVPDVFSYSRLRQVIICLIRDLGYTASPLILIIEAMEKYVDITGVRELTEKIAVELGEGFQLKNWCSHDKKCVI